jgi:hypothetical protein
MRAGNRLDRAGTWRSNNAVGKKCRGARRSVSGLKAAPRATTTSSSENPSAVTCDGWPSSVVAARSMIAKDFRQGYDAFVHIDGLQVLL